MKTLLLLLTILTAPQTKTPVSHRQTTFNGTEFLVTLDSVPIYILPKHVVVGEKPYLIESDSTFVDGTVRYNCGAVFFLFSFDVKFFEPKVRIVEGRRSVLYEDFR